MLVIGCCLVCDTQIGLVSFAAVVADVCPYMQMDQFFFMTDRHDPGFCCVRYITDVRLREWKVYLQPLAARKFKHSLCASQPDVQACCILKTGMLQNFKPIM